MKIFRNHHIIKIPLHLTNFLPEQRAKLKHHNLEMDFYPAIVFILPWQDYLPKAQSTLSSTKQIDERLKDKHILRIVRPPCSQVEGRRIMKGKSYLHVT